MTPPTPNSTIHHIAGLIGLLECRACSVACVIEHEPMQSHITTLLRKTVDRSRRALEASISGTSSRQAAIDAMFAAAVPGWRLIEALQEARRQGLGAADHIDDWVQSVFELLVALCERVTPTAGRRRVETRV